MAALIARAADGVSLPKRRPPPLKIQLRVALIQLGLDPDNVRLDHTPPLGLREIDEEADEWTPHQHSERHLQFLSTKIHDVKTAGAGATVADGDIHKIAKSRRLAHKEAEFRERLLDRPAKADKPKSKWPKRKFRT